MKICVIGNDYKQQLPLIGYGGIETAFENLCYGIHKYFSDTIQFCAFVPKIIEQKEKKPPFKVIETNYIESSKSGVTPIHFVSEIRDIIKNSNIKPDIIWSYSHWSALTLQELNIPIICTMMDSGGWEENKFIYKENVYYRFASKFIYDLTFKDADTFEHINKIKKQSFWLHTGISDEEYNFEPNKDNYILWVAGLNWGWQGKGLDIFLQLAQLRTDQQFVAYGTGSPQIEEQLKTVSKQLKNFEYMGTLIRGKEHKNIFKKAKLFTFLTQISEAFGRTGLEAITKGTPILGSTKGAVPELYEPIGVCTDDLNVMIETLDKKFNYQDIYNYSQKFHIKNEIEFLLNKSNKIYK
jgi:glycosyltransferase involved in cell wall biosynthesis